MFRVLVLLLSSAALAVGVLGLTKIEYKFDPVLLVPAESYFTKFTEIKNAELPSVSGYTAQVFTGEINGTHLEQLSRVHSQLDNIVKEGTFLESYESWWTPFVVYIEKSVNVNCGHRQLVITKQSIQQFTGMIDLK